MRFWVKYTFTFTLVPNDIAHSECVLFLTVFSNAFIVLSIKSSSTELNLCFCPVERKDHERMHH